MMPNHALYTDAPGRHGLCRRKGRASPWRAGQRTSRPALSTPCTENTFFAKSIPTVVTLVMTSPSRE